MSKSKIIGNKIAEARKKAFLSQAQLAQRLFISPQAVGKWERGESMPDIITFDRLAEILGIDLNYFSENHQAPEITAGEPSVQQAASSPSGGKKPSWDMSRGNLIDTDFSGLKNLHENFSSSNIQRCLFIGSALSGLLLKNNNIDSCDFSRSDISSSHFQNSSVANNQFKDCSLKDTEFSGSYIEACDFSGSDFTGAQLKSGGFGNNILTNCIWNRSSFNSMHIADTVFEGILEDCHFENCSFSGVTFQHATLINTFFKNNRRLKQIQFIDCKADKLTYAFLKNGKADLTGLSLLEE